MQDLPVVMFFPQPQAWFRADAADKFQAAICKPPEA
jgi:hypothetical protein